MRIWDIHPGYLNHQSLLAEHRELHELVSSFVNGMKDYSHHPEAMRWKGCGWALRQRHRQLACEMDLRGYEVEFPVRTRSNIGVWPLSYIEMPRRQFEMLKENQAGKDQGRIPLPMNTQALWSHHKYSVLARSTERYRDIGVAVADNSVSFEDLSLSLVEILRTAPGEGGIRNALHHMWGYVSDVPNVRAQGDMNSWPLKKLLSMIQENVMKTEQPYLINSTALSDLMVWL